MSKKSVNRLPEAEHSGAEASPKEVDITAFANRSKSKNNSGRAEVVSPLGRPAAQTNLEGTDQSGDEVDTLCADKLSGPVLRTVPDEQDGTSATITSQGNAETAGSLDEPGIDQGGSSTPTSSPIDNPSDTTPSAPDVGNDGIGRDPHAGDSSSPTQDPRTALMCLQPQPSCDGGPTSSSSGSGGTTEAGDLPPLLEPNIRSARNVVNCGLKETLVYLGSKRWMEFKSGSWVETDDFMVEHLVERQLERIIAGLKNTDSESPDSVGLISFLEGILANPIKYRQFVTMAKAAPELRTDIAKFDQEKLVLNVPNGSLDFRNPGNLLREHSAADRVTAMCPTVYDPSAPCPGWDEFVLDVMKGDPALVEYLQTILGSVLVGGNQLQAMFIFHGLGSSGKGTLFNAVCEVLGPDYAGTLDADTLSKGLSKEAIRNDLATLCTARIVVASESNNGAMLNESLVKTMTGSDSVRVRRKYHDSFEYRPQWTLFLQTNHLPVIDGMDDAIWRRVYLLPFERQFKADPQLPERLLKEKEGILRWLVDGAVKFVKAGRTVVKPAKIAALEAQYRNQSDSIERFLAECCDLGGATGVLRSALYDAYKAFCTDEGSKPRGKHDFNSAVRKLGHNDVKDGHGIYVWTTIALK